MASGKRDAKTIGARTDSRNGVKSCLRALEVIEYFTRSGAPARTIDISEALAIPNSSADEILRTLSGIGYLSYNRITKLYGPSYKLVRMSHQIEHAYFGGDFVPAILDDIRSETGATVYLTLQNDCWIESVAELRGGWQKRAEDVDFPVEIIHFHSDRWRPGTNFAAAMLAQISNAEILQLASRAQKLGFGPRGPALMKTLVDGVARTRARGFAMVRRNDTVLLDSIAVPLRMPNAVTPYAIGVVGDRLFASEGDIGRMAAALRNVIHRHGAGAQTMHDVRPVN